MQERTAWVPTTEIPEKVPARDVGQLKVPDYPVADGSLTRPRRSYQTTACHYTEMVINFVLQYWYLPFSVHPNASIFVKEKQKEDMLL
jgi:hypothetical protein